MASPSFAELLRHHRLTCGLTQAELAERAGLSTRGISDLERGLKQAPRASTVRLLVRGLGLADPEATAFLSAAQPGQNGHSELERIHDRHNLPLATTSFIAREGELVQLEHVLNESRLLTITGAGGSGKTRLALELAQAHVNRFGDGVWLVELASLADPSLVTQTAVTTLLVSNASGSADEVLTEFLRNRQVLLVLDNCEHVVDACALMVERLLRSCAEVRVIATSRERLGIPGEVVHRVTGLGLPTHRATVHDVAASEAGRLFLQRARHLVPDLTLDPAGAAAVARICRRLDGIPLAIELAATAARALSLEDLAARLDDRFRLLRGAGRTAPPRQQTLRATMDWSYQLLEADEVALFRRLAVFASGFDVAAVEAVHGPDGLPVLLRLIDKSLVLTERRGRVQRYRMLETVRQYGEEKLVDSGEATAVRERHRDHYVSLAEDAASGLAGPDADRWFERLQLEHDNLRAALAWCQADPDGAEKEERLAGALGRFWCDGLYNREGFEWLMHAARRRPGVVTVGRGRALNWAAMVAQHGDLAHEQQAALLEESVSVLRQADDLGELSLVLRHLWSNHMTHNRVAATDSALLDESLAVARRAGSARDVGWGLIYLTEMALRRREVAKARRLADEALTVMRGLDLFSDVNALTQVGRVALAENDPTRAESAFGQAMERSQAGALPLVVCLDDASLGMAGALRARGDTEGARSCIRELVSNLRASSATHLLPRVVLGLALLEAGCGREQRAAWLLGAFDASGASVPGWSLDGYYLGPDLPILRARFEHQPYAACLAAGRLVSVNQALDESLAFPCPM
jgi:predicted ATPase/DNA-binding XRE family transcriptional regulator